MDGTRTTPRTARVADLARARRRALARTAAALTGLALCLTAGACGLVGDDDAPPPDEAATESGPDAGGGGAGGAPAGERSRSDAGSNLDRSRSDAASDMERRVSETLSELDAEVRGGDTVITLPERILFEFDQDVLLPEAAATLDGIAEAITFYEDAPVRVIGHTDARGDTAYNQDLSQRRAAAVADYLVTAGVEAGRITAEGRGETEPIAPNENADGSDDPEGRAQNRRVEVVIEGVDPADLEG